MTQPTDCDTTRRPVRPIRPLTTDAYPDHITPGDLAMLGSALLSAACAMNALGHDSPTGLADYVDPTALGDTWHARFVLDMVAYAAAVSPDKRKHDALDRIHGFVWQSGMMHEIAEAVTR